MMHEKKALIQYRLERADEALREAQILLKEGYANTFVNRLYYACFYAVTALLLTRNLSSAKHNGVRMIFHQNFVKPGIVPVEFGHLYDTLFRNRQKGDYADLVRFDIDEVRHWNDKAREFVEAINVIVKKELTNS